LTELISAEKTRLNSLMDRPPEAPLGEPDSAPFPRLEMTVEDLFAVAAENREELRIADRAIERARAREALAESQYAPDFTIGGSYVEIDRNRGAIAPPKDNGQDAYGVILGVSIPLWANRTTAGVREARAAREAAVRGKAETWNQTFTAVKDAFFKLTNAERLVLLYRDSLIPQAKQVMLSTEELAREDRLRLGDYLEAQTVWLNFTLAMERALADYNQSIARLERLTGTTVVPVDEEADR
ncbi:MAG: TolC family protein, partial [Planctomycetota bacterium]